MMLLSDRTIREMIEAQKIEVYPTCRPEDIRPVGIRLHLGRELLVPIAGRKVHLSSSEEIPFERVDLGEKEFVLRPGQFVLGSSLERFQIPRDMVGHIEGRSTIARLGLAIHCTSGIIDGNFEEARSVVFELKNGGSFEIVLEYKIALAMLTFSYLSTEIEQRAQEQYAGQKGVVAPRMSRQKR